MSKTGNHIIDGDDGRDCRSPKHKGCKNCELEHQDDITINIIEAASKLAHNRIKNQFPDEGYIENKSGDLNYTEEAQNKYNHFYDYYLEVLLGEERKRFYKPIFFNLNEDAKHERT